MKNKSNSGSRHTTTTSRRSRRGNNNNKNINKNMSTTRMINPLGSQFSRSHMIVAPIFRTSCGIDYFGYHTAGLNKQTFAISGNSLHLPFNSALIVTNGISINAAGFTPYTGSVYTTMQPAGFLNLCGNAAPYLNYRVLGSRIKIKFFPLSLEDTVICTTNLVSTGEQWNTSVWTGAEAPYASRTASFTASTNDRALQQNFTSAEAFGVPEIAIRDGVEYAGAFNTSPENEWDWIVNLQSISTNTTASVGVLIEINYDVEFWNPATGGLNDV